MAADIYNAFLGSLRSVDDYNAIADQRKAQQQAQIANALGLQIKQEELAQQRRSFADADALRQEQQGLYQALPGLDTSKPGFDTELMARFPRAAPSYLKDFQERQSKASKTADEQSQTAARTMLEARRTLGAVFANPSKQFARSQLAVFKSQFPNANIDAYAAQIEALPEDPNAIKQWAAGHGAEVDKLLPKLGVSDGGGANNFYAQSPVTGAVDFTRTEKKTMTPGEAQDARNDLVGPDGQINQTALGAKKAVASAGASRVSVGVNTEKTYAGNIAEGLAKNDVAAIEAAQTAPQRIQTAQRVKQILTTQKPITGTAAEIRLGVNKALSTAGIIDGKSATATEDLASDLASSTLDAIKTSGLGGGQGFTDKDRQFLERAKSGNIEMTPQAIYRLADLNEKAATA